jgi:hypothetical protein
VLLKLVTDGYEISMVTVGVIFKESSKLPPALPPDVELILVQNSS